MDKIEMLEYMRNTNKNNIEMNIINNHSHKHHSLVI